MSRRRGIARVSADASDAWLVLRCSGRRVVVGFGPGADDVVALVLAGRERDEEAPWRAPTAVRRFLWGTNFTSEEATGPDQGEPRLVVRCAAHARGHEIDGEKLRALVDLRCRPGRQVSEQVARVVVDEF